MCQAACWALQPSVESEALLCEELTARRAEDLLCAQLLSPGLLTRLLGGENDRSHFTGEETYVRGHTALRGRAGIHS